MTGTTAIIGFDSAWTDKAPGAICALILDADGKTHLKAPELVHFDGALTFVAAHYPLYDVCLVAIDQPTIVPNLRGCRKVDRVAGSVICYMGGGVQPANRAKRGLFDDDAPVWRFKAKLGAKEDPELSRITEGGLFIMEVFPALALATFNHAFFRRLKGPRYNPASKDKFRSEDWLAVIETVRKYAQIAKLDAIEAWAEELSRIHPPCKADQDRLDSVLCALVGYHWRTTPRENSIMIGDLTCGYMIAPVDSGTRERLEKSAARYGVPCG